MPSIVVDAGPLIALFRDSDQHHWTAKSFIEKAETATLVTNLFVIGEVAAMIGHDHDSLGAFLDWVQLNLEIDGLTVADLPRAAEIIEKYRDLPADLADASLVALCERRGIAVVATIDRDFEVYRLPMGQRFENVFFQI
jgi:hypothetical protein